MSPYYAGGLGIPYTTSMLNYPMGLGMYGMGLGGLGMMGLGGMGMGLGMMGLGGMGMGMGYPYGMMMQNPYGYSGMVRTLSIFVPSGGNVQ
jgi:hypothetical protein